MSDNESKDTHGYSARKTKKDLHKEDPELCSDDSEDSEGGDEVDGATRTERDSPDEEGLAKFINALTIGGKDEDDDRPEQVLDEVSFDGVARYIASGHATNIVTMSGAGISTSAGIPDFRTPGTGLYDNLQKYDLPNPQAIFTLDYFRRNPQPFFTLAKELYPGSFKPTPSHLFIKLLQDKGLLLRHYTQNIDTLERQAGVDPDKLVEAHGTFASAHCVGCGKEYSQEFVKDAVFADSIPCCDDCNATVKPDIVFFGESLPDRFHRLVSTDFHRCDLLIIMGTSLTVQPFAGLVDM